MISSRKETEMFSVWFISKYTYTITQQPVCILQQHNGKPGAVKVIIVDIITQFHNDCPTSCYQIFTTPSPTHVLHVHYTSKYTLHVTYIHI